ncbi:hypothetical protein [Telmatospirillum sp.]|uniref:hypothetical protein n=1 Tax=Telmatospirillum sp. TaxID=2079197 RepID=UPI00284F733F|nr:hypothetical protein [Telmatospirillum sp.]MDR3437614.1 hypothetical protein [Telmatospirillum sp.]
MVARLAFPFLVLAALSLSGCIVGDSIAHVVKLAQGSGQKNESSGTPAAAAPAPAAVHDEAPPPPPAAAPTRDSVSVETLAPPSH